MLLENSKSKKNSLNKKIDSLIELLEKSNLMELTYILGSKKQVFIRNILAGISRGVGIGIGITLITAIIVYILQRIVSLNIPIFGEYIADIVAIVEKSR